MLSLRELRRAGRIVEEQLRGATVRRVVQPGDQQILLVLEKSSRSHLLLSGNPEFARICLGSAAETVESPGSFYEYARAHLPGTVLEAIELSREDRQLGLRLKSGTGRFVLILSILGSRSNVYLLDSEGKLIHSLRPFEETRRELRIGELWADPQGSVRSEGIDRWESLPDPEYLYAVGQSYAQLELEREAEQLVRKIEQALKKERTFLDRKAVNLQEDLGEAKKAEIYKRTGELLKNVLHTIRPGDDTVEATDYETGQIHRIPLDPKLSPAENLEACFNRYQKDSRGVKMIEQQLDELQAARAELEAIEGELREAAGQQSAGRPALTDLVSDHRVRRLIQRHAPKRKQVQVAAKSTHKKEIPTRLLPKRYRTQDGLEIWVGRSDEGNDYLTTRLARGNDLFFHLEGYPGSHVVLRTEGQPDPPPKSVLDACELAVHFSKMKNAGSADVHMAHIKDVKKPKGAKPGLVYVRSGKSIRLRRDAKRLQSILASRLDQ